MKPIDCRPSEVQRSTLQAVEMSVPLAVRSHSLGSAALGICSLSWGFDSTTDDRFRPQVNWGDRTQPWPLPSAFFA